eukprot:4359259-Amphidinium_carterae.1
MRNKSLVSVRYVSGCDASEIARSGSSGPQLCLASSGCDAAWPVPQLCAVFIVSCGCQLDASASPTSRPSAASPTFQPLHGCCCLAVGLLSLLVCCRFDICCCLVSGAGSC